MHTVADKLYSPVFLRSVMGMYGSWLFVFLRLMTGLFWYVLRDSCLLFTAKAFQVRYTDIFGCKSNIHLSVVYVWTQMEGSAQQSARVGRYLNKAADLFLHRLDFPGPICKSHS